MTGYVHQGQACFLLDRKCTVPPQPPLFKSAMLTQAQGPELGLYNPCVFYLCFVFKSQVWCCMLVIPELGTKDMQILGARWLASIT